jgi:plasmid stabilization system protein ParE
MKINFSKDSKDFLLNLKEYISQDNPIRARQYTTKLVTRISEMLQYPYIGKINTSFDDESIREIVIDGMKIIYKIHPKSVAVLMIYKYIDFDEKTIEVK